MEYIYFVISIAAIGFFLFLYWQISAIKRKNRALLDDSARFEPAPPLKKTISGPSEKELEQIRFQEKVEMWQRGFGVRHAWQNRSNHQSLNGTKYTYEPPKKSRVEERKAAQQSASTSQGLHGWQMIG